MRKSCCDEKTNTPTPHNMDSLIHDIQRLTETVAEHPLTSRREIYKAYIEKHCDNNRGHIINKHDDYHHQGDGGNDKKMNIQLPCPDFPPGLTWVNVREALSLNDQLRGKIVILDFFTYCCINCLHILPDLHALEEQYTIEDGVVIIGVHSAKFPNEKDSSNIEQAVQRYGINHPVVNDSNALMWSELQIQCWPTLVVLDPAGFVLTQYVGEGHGSELQDFVAATLDVYASSLSHATIPLKIGNQTSSFLRYPGKIMCTPTTLIISDTGHHRILICDPKNGQVKECIGDGTAGNVDGTYTSSRLHSPQGLCVIGNYLYVADSEAHTIRQIDMNARTVTTIAGTGEMGSDKIGGKPGCMQPISSPWDVKPYRSIASENLDMLIIAAAGTHQIWGYFITDGKWWKNSSYQAGTCIAIAGSGAEENRNNSYPNKAGFAQPSGLSIDYDKNLAYIADSESSTVRQLSLVDGAVKGLVGGARDPSDLFAFGDVDGKTVDVKLQHPLDVAVIPTTDHLIICDSYNHKVKLCNVKKKTVVSLDLDSLSEPSGMCFDTFSERLYIVDTNNHSIKYVKLDVNQQTLQTSELNVVQVIKDIPDSSESKPLFKHDSKQVKHIKAPLHLIKDDDSSLIFTHDVSALITAGHHLTEESTMSWRATSCDKGLTIVQASGELEILDPVTVMCDIPVSAHSDDCDSPITLSLEMILFYCDDDGKVCKRLCVMFIIPLACVGPSHEDDWYKNIPKVELHAHLNGSISDRTLKELIDMKSGEERERLRSFVTCIDHGQSRTLAECFEMFKLVHQIVNTEESIYKATCDVIRDFAEDGVVYLELRSTPKDIPSSGITKRKYIEIILRAIEDMSDPIESITTYEVESKRPIVVRYLPSIDKRNSVAFAEETVALAIEYRENTGLVVGIDLSGDEAANDGRDFIPILKKAQKHGLKLALHLGEIDGAEESSLEMLDLPPDRIGHGVYIHPDSGGSEKLYSKTRDGNIPLELCLTSNVKGEVTATYDVHHFQHWYKLDHPLCICTDDKGIFGTNLSNELKQVSESFNIPADAIRKLVTGAVNHLFEAKSFKETCKAYMDSHMHTTTTNPTRN